MDQSQLIQGINKDLSLALPEKINLDLLHAELTGLINVLIRDDFQKLISILYRVDVSEQKLKGLLQEHPKEDAGKIIASLIIERQLEKIKSRKQYKQPKDDFDEEEKW